MKLTQDDVRRLLNEPAPEIRADVASKLAGHHASGKLKQNELLVAEQIFRMLVRDTEVQVRAALAEGLKADHSVPKDILQHMAQDAADEVALPVLQYAESLDDEDLIDVIREHENITRSIAIANRKQVSSMVSAALVETQNEDVVTQLVKNDGAHISEHSMKKIVRDFEESESVITGVIQRAELPLTVVESLVTLVSESVAEELKKKHSGAAQKFEEKAQQTREKMTLGLLDGAQDEKEVLSLVDQLYSEQRLTPSMILTSLCRGNFVFFEASLARMAGIPLANAQKLINDKGELGFRSLYKKASLPESMFDACKVVLDVMHQMDDANEGGRPGSIHYANRLVEKVFAHTQGREVDNLAYLIALIRQNIR